jgi:outer membrane receptor protein involved in Fe transport
MRQVTESQRTSNLRGISLASLAAALLLPMPALAQDAAEAPAPTSADAPAAAAEPPVEAETIVVTGSRIARSGFSAPTPVTVLGGERLQALAITNVADALNQLPSFRASGSPSNQQTFGGNVGARVLDLRALGAPRTLVLVDGRRFVPSTSEGTVDINLIPSGLVQRTEVVTGGASAVYGSDAVAGVVNFILDRKFTGFKAEVVGGISERGDDANQFASFAAGFDVGERGHFVIAAEYENNDGLAGCYEARDWCAQERSIVGNTPAGTRGQPSSIISSDVHASTVSPGGLINRSLNAAGAPIFANVANDPLRGVKFNADGTPGRFAYGDFAGPLFMIGGDGHARNPYLSSVLLKVPVERYSAYGSGSYELTDDIKASVDLSFGRVRGTTLSSTFRDFNGSLIGNLKADNPYLPASVAQIMRDNNIAQVTFGRSGFDFGSPKAVSTTKTYRAVAGLEGSLGSNWKWDGYYQYGRTDFYQAISNDPINANLRKAFDAVRTPSGSIVCRVNADATTANDDPACVPINLIGEGQFTDAARAYVIGSGFQKTRNTQQVAAVNLSGELFKLWQDQAVSLSVGAEYRRNTIDGTTDPISAVNGFWVLNGSATNGKQTVKEAYAETVVPLLRDLSFARSLELNGAVRYTDYSNSGSVTTWKIGGVYEPVRALRLRVTRSRDIRAPNLSELVGPQTKSTIGLTDPLTGLQANPVVIRGSNPNLDVEKADSFTAGFVIAPTGGFLSRLRLSVDYFDIKVDDAIGLLGAQTLVQRCIQGATEFCPLIVRDASNTVTQVSDVLLNANAVKTKGYDIEFDYRQPLGQLGDLSIRALATITEDLITTDSAGSLDRAGQTGSRAGTVLGVPDYTIDGLATWSKGPGSLTFHGRYIPAGSYNVSFIGPDDPNYAPTLPTSVNTNRVPGRFYLDVAGTLRVAVGSGREFELFGSVNNLLDRDPPAIPSGNLGTNQVLFDPIGRAFRLGARVRFGG